MIHDVRLDIADLLHDLELSKADQDSCVCQVGKIHINARSLDSLVSNKWIRQDILDGFLKIFDVKFPDMPSLGQHSRASCSIT